MNIPTRSQIEAWTTAHLQRAANVWTDRANHLQENYEKAQSALGGARWAGPGADQARDRLFRDLVDMRRAEDLLRQAAQTAQKGAETIADAQRAALATIRNAENRLFTVNDDLTLKDRLPNFPNPFRWLREHLARALEAEIRGLALQLAATDQQVANALKTISASLREFGFEGPGPTPDNPDHPGEPTITGPAGPLKYEQDKYDLQVAFPDGKGPTLGGDPQTHDRNRDQVEEVPRDPDSEKANDPTQPGTRPIPTGTAIGSNGERYAFFSYPDGTVRPGENPYSTPGKAWDYSDPDNPKPLGPLTYPGPDGRPMPVYQPSGAYDKSSGKMLIVGNTTNKSGAIERVLFESAPIKPGDPPEKWLQTLRPSGVIEGMPGARENQLVALEGGGFALVGSDNVDRTDPSRQAVSAVTASTAEGLKTAVPTTIVGPVPTVSNQGLAAPYGPTIIGTTYDPVTGHETIDLRVSTWDGVNKDGQPKPYNPQTYTTTFTVQH
ncbi:hypothetical protein A5638_28685 [Mycolicibacterium fortuitum]|uniref:hypothetical protein n=1 Tax=Mycolicibacterium fortuitum TaxID=1766 RepID=UPI0007EDC6E3|nr:hypothetical protein [Mycolicibacterium fortuitum]OBJ92568.1 hypothetical protein A5638_28685 [Mycolicibacterium fortuitum]